MKLVKLIGSRQEKEFRAQFSKARVSSFTSGTSARLKKLVAEAGFDPTQALLINHTPEQGEDLYSVLIWSNTIFHAEIDRFDSSVKPIIEIESLEDHNIAKTQIEQIKIAVALETLKQILQNKA